MAKKFIVDIAIMEQAIALARKGGHDTLFLSAFSNPDGVILTAQVKDTAKGKGKPFARCGREWVNYKAQPTAQAAPAPAPSVPAGTDLPF